ncbi:hypothetical protein HBI56_084750 [Parastagonospora nodorum]|nr:hypothetical protein HBH56_101810 [Parastagonospora nodorum]KAH3929203.1 hypothetical protein HBH54_128620 [Parastagonospora nodorum]KAH3951425.1 hypothetical protein HBH53_062610 [Parastagonospora nodorum]KAH3975497.1 hypothetical protein HBH52_124240 [Parastagonospora nodorum]KAH3978872.1 hypothetical protein HBH51_061180 [Parastagonospora nodorum]
MEEDQRSESESSPVSISRMHMALAVCAGRVNVFVASCMQILTSNQSSNEIENGWRPCWSYIESMCSNP